MKLSEWTWVALLNPGCILLSVSAGALVCEGGGLIEHRVNALNGSYTVWYIHQTSLDQTQDDMKPNIIG